MANSTQSSICGIGLGSENCYVAVARQGGIEIILNEYSQYSTPAYVGLGGNQRDLGTSAKQKQMTHLRSTYFAPSLLLGKTFSEMQQIPIPFAIEEGPNDSILVSIEHAGQSLTLTPTQLLAMIFTKLRHIGGNPIDCVINCPSYFNVIQRHQIMDAARIAGLNPLKLINDTTSVALFHGFYKTPTDRESSIICFFDCGQSSSQSSIYLFNHKENSLTLLDTQYQDNVGGRDFDQLIANYFIDSQNLKLNNRARYRLYAECEKLKKQMSANSNDLPISIECLYEDRDFAGRMDRAKFQELSEHLLNKLEGMLQRNLEGATAKYKKMSFPEKFGDFKISSVEVFGGSSRIPAVKQLVKTVFNVEPSTTLNADEAVARGCALQCAILSPNFKISKALNLYDGTSYEIKFAFDFKGENDQPKWIKFPPGTTFPVTKKVTGLCKKFPIHAVLGYDGTNGNFVIFSEYLIKEPQGLDLSEVLEKNPVTFRIPFDANGTVFLESASISYEKPTAPEPEPMEETSEQPSSEKMEVDEAAAEKKKKPKTVTVDLILEVVSFSGKLSPSDLQKSAELEADLVLEDKNWKEKTDAKNALEEFIYEWREKLLTLETFISQNEKKYFKDLLDLNENWLFEQEEENIMHSRSVYDKRTNEMRGNYSDRILHRKREFENIPSLLVTFGQALQQANKFVQFAEEAEKETIGDLKKEIVEKQEYFDSTQGQIKNWECYEDPPTSCDEIRECMNQLQDKFNNAQNARKRIQEQQKRAAEEAARKAAEDARKAADEAKKAAEEAKKVAEATKEEEPIIDSVEEKKEPKIEEISTGTNSGQMDID